MNLKHLILFISAVVISTTGADEDFEDFCTLSGTLTGLTDFSSIFVKLLNKFGNLKEKTEVSENGFFVLPIYDKGEYTIKVAAPAGYSFEPEEILFNFDGVNDICSQKKDVNFAFKGFGITGKVNIFNEPSAGAKGVTVSLFNDKNQLIAKTTSDDSGIYTFSPIVPGKYRIAASHASWHFSKYELSVTVSTGNTEVPSDSLQVSGFNLFGHISQPSVKMGFVIYSAKNQKNLHNCAEKSTIKQTSFKDYEAEPLCFTSVITNGEFSFRNLASGRYLIIPHTEKSDIEFNISPAQIEAEIVRDNHHLNEAFEISGFSASGRVYVSQQTKKGIKNAEIKLNGKVMATTDASGAYTLKNIKDGTYTIQVTAQDLQFSDHTVKIAMTNPNVPDIFVSGFKVCGKVMSEQSFRVAIKKHGSTFFTETSSKPSDGGSFCVFLGNGKYSFEVLIDENERKSVQFYPIQQTIEVNSGSISDIIFSQLRAKVAGKVSCLPDDDNSCKSIDVSLTSLDETGYQTSSVKARVVDGEYNFEEILPGRYQLTVPSDSLCWEDHQQNIVVKSTLEIVPTFVQSGFRVGPIIASHDTKAAYKLRRDEKSTEIQLTSGANVLCVPRAGTYDLKVSGCHTFEEESKVLTTKSSTPVHINAVKHRNGVRILSEIAQQFTIETEFEDGTKKILKPTQQAEKVDGYVAYKIHLDLKSGEFVKLSPKSEQMLFKPAKTEWKGASDCIEVAVNFIATKGLVIAGKTEPLIGDVSVNLIFPKNPEMASMVTTTNSVGEFKFPTIDPTIDFELKAEKESYTFAAFDAGRNVFVGNKLCEIIVQVQDEEAKELSGVVISVSGGDNYRKNLATVNGEIKFHSLRPGKYYLRAMMKEYDFKPNSQTLEIKDGETVNVDLRGKRVAYSVFGKITTLSGDAFANVLVEAVSSTEACSNHQEEAVTEFNGQYRIRGLQTGCDYKIRLQTNANVERSIPKERGVEVKATDTENVNFIAINPINLCDVIVKIKSKSNEHYKTLKIQMFKKESPDAPIYSQRIENLMLPKSKEHNDNVMVFLPRINAHDFQKYFFIELTTTLSEKNYNFKLPSIQFQANTTSHYFVVEFDPILKQPETELNKNSLVALLLIFLVGFVFLKHELVFETATNLWAKFNSVDSVASRQPVKKSEGRGENFIDEKEINQLAQFIEERKKKKSKKTN